MKIEYVKNLSELARRLCVNRGTVYRWQAQGFPEKTGRGWPLKACQDFATTALAHAAEMQTGQNVDLKRMKLQAQIMKIKRDIERTDLALQKERDELMPVTEHLEDVAVYARIFDGVFKEWLQYVSAITRDPKLLQKMKEIDRRIRYKLIAAIDAA